MCSGCKLPAFKRILVAVDESRQSEWATTTAGELALALGAEVVLVHAYRFDASFTPELAIPVQDVLDNLRKMGVDLLRQRRAMLPASLQVTEIVTEGDPAGRIVDQALAEGADLIVMGTHGRGRLAQFLIGSTTETVIRKAHCPVLAIAHEPRARVTTPPEQVKQVVAITPARAASVAN